MKRAALLAGLTLLGTPALAQQTPVTTFPAPVRVMTQASGTITTTSTFQVILAANTSRLGCTIQNNGTHVMYVYFGPFTQATTTNGFQVAASGGSLNCYAGPIVVPYQVSITGTSGDAYVVTEQSR